MAAGLLFMLILKTRKIFCSADSTNSELPRASGWRPQQEEVARQVAGPSGKGEPKRITF
jgi:hypothetical protein